MIGFVIQIVVAARNSFVKFKIANRVDYKDFDTSLLTVILLTNYGSRDTRLRQRDDYPSFILRLSFVYRSFREYLSFWKSGGYLYLSS